MLIRYYNNRKMYNTVLKRYTNLSEIQQQIQVGISVQVLDRQHTDVTADVLARVILNLSVPPKLLENLIKNHKIGDTSNEQSSIQGHEA
jgi:polyhydroxyalkanoate synthesis regulator protein